MPRIPTRNFAAAGLLSLCVALPASGIEMFTYFGDGSRIGLPSLEVPVQAYPGIPLRSDRIRARSRAQQVRRAAPPQGTNAEAPRPSPGSGVAPGIPGGGITIRPMPRHEGYGGTNGPSSSTPHRVSAPSVPSASVPPGPDTRPVGGPAAPPRSGDPRGPVTQPAGSPYRPEPVAPPREAPLPGFSQPVFPSGR